MDESLLDPFSESLLQKPRGDGTDSMDSEDSGEDAPDSMSSSLSFDALSESSVEEVLHLDGVNTLPEVDANDIEVLQTSGYVKVEEAEATQAGAPPPRQQSRDSSSTSDTESSSAEEVASVNEQIDSFLKVIDSQFIAASTAQEADSTSDSFPNESGGGDIDGSSMTIRPPAPPVALAADPASDNPPTAVVAAPTNQPTMRVTSQDDMDSGIDDDDDDIEDETLSERLWGLTEMFPDRLRTSSKLLFDFSCNSSKFLYVWGRKTLWVVATSVIVLYLPVALEVEKLQMEKDSLGQAQDILLGPQSGSKSVDSSAPPMPTIPQ